MSRFTSRQSALLALIVLILVWGNSWIFMKLVMQYAGPFEFAALRFLIGAAVLFVVMWVRGQSLKPTPLKLTLAVGLFQTAGFQGFVQWALVSGGAGHTSLLAYTMPFWAVLLAWFLLAERPNRQQIIGLVLAVAGLVCIMEPWQGLGGLFSALLAVAGGICWALSVIFTKRMFQLHTPSPLGFTAWQMLLGAIALCILALAVPSQPINWAPQLIIGLAYTAVLASSLAWFLWTFVVQRLPTAVAGLSSLGVPVTAVLMAWLILQERPDGMEFAGIMLIALALFAVSGIGRYLSPSKWQNLR